MESLGKLVKDSSVVASTRAAPEAEAVLRELNKILESTAFRGSERSKHFLQFVVQQAVDGQTDNLKERVIGAEVFGRPRDYETSGDAIVRVKANEVRKRLAQYYDEAGSRDVLRIELPAGSYVPRFERQVESEAKLAPEIAVGRRFNKWHAILLAAAVVLMAFGSWAWIGRASDFDRFWDATLKGSGTPVIYLGTSVTYRATDKLDRELENLKQPILVAPGDFVRLANYHIPIGHLYAVTQICSVLQSRGKIAELRPGGELKLEDISGRPVILIGGYSNAWTMQMHAKLRFWQDDRSIHDSQNSARVWRVDKRFPWAPQNVDYAVISRVWDVTSGSVFVTAAGINVFGTQAAGEFLTHAQYWNDLARHLAPGWTKKNLQVVLETAVVGSVPSPPRVAATNVW